MKSVLARTAGYLPAITILLACAVGVTVPVATPNLSTLTTILWLLGAGAAICLLLRRAIDADDRTRELAGRLAREQELRRSVDLILDDTQAVAAVHSLYEVVDQVVVIGCKSDHSRRLQTIAHIRQSTPDNDAHSVIEIRLF